MPSSIGAYVGWACAITASILGLLNGAVMLISPRSWLRLPRWLRAQGTLAEESHSSGSGALQVRLLGAAIVGVISWIFFEIFAGTLATSWLTSLFWDPLRRVMMAIVVVFGFINGVLMVLSPAKWFRLPKLFATRGTATRHFHPTWARDILVRLGGGAVLVVAVYACKAVWK